MNYLQKYGRQGNSTTYCSDTVMPYITRTQQTDGQRDASALSPRKVASELSKNYRGITHISIVAKIYNALQLNRIEPEIEKILRKNHSFRRNWPTISQILKIRRFFYVRVKSLEATLLFVDSSKVFKSIHRGKMEQILLTYGLSRETIEATMMLYKNTKVKVCPALLLIFFFLLW